MLDLFKQNPRAFALAVALHLVLILFFLVGVDWLVKPKVYHPPVEVVQAKVVDEQRIAAEAARLKQAQEQQVAAEQAAKAKAERELRELETQKQREQQRLKELEQKRQAEQRRQQEAEKARKQAEEKKRQAEAERKKQEAAEAKRKEEARQKAEAERKVREEAERKRKAAEQAERQRREQELQQALEAEQNSRAINAFAAAVSQRVTGNWIRPPGSDRGLTCRLRIRLSDRGTVLAVQLVQSSGNTPFDRSAEAAVWKSDPLPAPPGGLREINFTFEPDAL